MTLLARRLGLLLLVAFILPAQRCQVDERACTDIDMTVTIGAPGTLIPGCHHFGTLRFLNTEVVTFPGLDPALRTAEVPQSNLSYGILMTATAAAKSGTTIPVTLHDVPDPNFPRLTDDYTIHVTFVGTRPAILESISVTPANVTLVPPATQQYTATGHYNDGSTTDLTSVAQWASTDIVAAPISSSGLVTAESADPTVTISATDLATGIVGTTTLTVQVPSLKPVLQSISVTPNPGTVFVGQTLQLTATGSFSDGTIQVLSGESWASSDATVATVSNQAVVTGGQIAVATDATISATDTPTGIVGSALVHVLPAPGAVVTAQPNPTGGSTNLDCVAQGGLTGQLTYKWRAYRDDGTTGDVLFSNPNVQAPTAILSGDASNFYAFCTVTNTSNQTASGYGSVTLSTGDTIVQIAIGPSAIHAGTTTVTFDATSSLNANTPAVSWNVQYAGNVVPQGLEGYLTIPQANWTTVFTDVAPVGLMETVPAANFSNFLPAGAYRVQLTVTSSNDFSNQSGTFYFQVVP